MESGDFTKTTRISEHLVFMNVKEADMGFRGLKVSLEEGGFGDSRHERGAEAWTEMDSKKIPVT